jgi:transcriptional regulator with XRE-family HTH domain
VIDGLRKATLIDFASGKSNQSATTIGAILDAFNMSLSEFATYYDRITEKDIIEYKKEIEQARRERLKLKEKVKNAVKKDKPRK